MHTHVQKPITEEMIRRANALVSDHSVTSIPRLAVLHLELLAADFNSHLAYCLFSNEPKVQIFNLHTLLASWGVFNVLKYADVIKLAVTPQVWRDHGAI